MDRRRTSPTRPKARLPMGKAPDEWSYGDLEAGFKNAAVDRRRDVRRAVHRPSADGNAQRDGLLAERQAVSPRVDAERRSGRSIRLPTGSASTPSNIVLISEYCGGGFGSKGGGAVSMAIPALLSKKTGVPVMMRISREEEHYIGRARTGMVGRAQVGFAQGRSHHRARSLHRRGQRRLRADGRLSVRRQRRVADLAAARRCAGAASPCSPTRRRGRSSARRVRCRPTRSWNRWSRRRRRSSASISSRSAASTRPKARRCTARRGRTASAPHITERVRERGARSRRRVVQVGRAEGARRASGRDRRSAASASPSDRTAPARSATTA